MLTCACVHVKSSAAQASLEAIASTGLLLEKRFPKYSPDLNAIEGVWRLLRQRLNENTPAGQESRLDFVRRLCGAAAWLNANEHDELRLLCTNEKSRAADIIRLSGPKTKW